MDWVLIVLVSVAFISLAVSSAVLSGAVWRHSRLLASCAREWKDAALAAAEHQYERHQTEAQERVSKAWSEAAVSRVPDSARVGPSNDDGFGETPERVFEPLDDRID